LNSSERGIDVNDILLGECGRDLIGCAIEDWNLLTDLFYVSILLSLKLFSFIDGLK
jgi:hypothetical protein